MHKFNSLTLNFSLCRTVKNHSLWKQKKPGLIRFPRAKEQKDTDLQFITGELVLNRIGVVTRAGRCGACL